MSSNDWIIQKCHQHMNYCQGEIKNAQGWIKDERSAQKRHLLWKEAAQSGLTDMTKIINMAKNNQTKTNEMKNSLVNIWAEKDRASRQVLGICGYDSAESNRVQKNHRNTIKDILLKL